MLSRSAHIAYLSALVALAVLLVRPVARDRAPRKEADLETIAAIDDHLGVLAAFEPMAQAQDGALAENPTESQRPDANQELIQRALEVAREIDPELGGRLARLHDKNPASFERVMRHANVGRNLFSMAHLKQRDPELYQVKRGEMMHTVAVNRTAAQVRDAKRTNSAGQVSSLTSQLRTMLQIQLAMQIKNKGDYICRIEEQLARAREELDREANAFQQTVEGRLKYLVELPANESSEEDELNLQLNPIKAPE